MLKQSRPLLAGIVESWKELERQAYQAARVEDRQAVALSEWQAALRELGRAENLLWLADQQWFREERLQLSQPNASPDSKG